MKRNLLAILSAVLVVGLLTGCGAAKNESNNGSNNNNEPTTTTQSIKGNCRSLDCIKQIEVDSSIDAINSIMGFEGELKDEKNEVYIWNINDDEYIKVQFYKSKASTITASYDKNSLKNSSVDFSRYNELKPKISSGIKYDEFITYIGNVDGTLIEKSSFSNKYIWVNAEGGYLNGSFSQKDNQATFVSGMF